MRAAGAPENLVQFVYGFAEAGKALVTGGVDKLIFVGSTAVGKKVAAVQSFLSPSKHTYSLPPRASTNSFDCGR